MLDGGPCTPSRWTAFSRRELLYYDAMVDVVGRLMNATALRHWSGCVVSEMRSASGT